MTTGGTLYFPLRANANTLLAGAPFARFRERLKVASLLHERVLLDDGLWMGAGGANAIYQMHVPQDKAPPERLRLQSARQRHQAVGLSFSLHTSQTPDGDPDTPVFEATADLYWEATFEPIRRELPRGYAWIDFDHVGLTDEGKAIARAVHARPHLDLRATLIALG